MFSFSCIIGNAVIIFNIECTYSYKEYDFKQFDIKRNDLEQNMSEKLDIAETFIIGRYARPKLGQWQ